MFLRRLIISFNQAFACFARYLSHKWFFHGYTWYSCNPKKPFPLAKLGLLSCYPKQCLNRISSTHCSNNTSGSIIRLFFFASPVDLFDLLGMCSWIFFCIKLFTNQTIRTNSTISDSTSFIISTTISMNCYMILLWILFFATDVDIHWL